MESLVSAQTYFDVIHVCFFELFFKVGVFLEVLDDFPEVAVIVQPSVLKHKKSTHQDLIKIYISLDLGPLFKAFLPLDPCKRLVAQNIT